MPINIDEVRRAFEQHPIAGTSNGTNGDGDAARRGDATSGDGTSVASVARSDEHVGDGDRTVSPADAARPADAGKRARPAANVTGSSNTRTRGRSAVVTTRPETVSNLEKLLFTTHALIAARTHIDSLSLPPSQAKELAAAIGELNSVYGGKGGVIGPKTYAWINMLIALGGTYGPMLKDARKEIREKTQSK
jgi:hypothetical protein